ncbi:hypothetical protein HYT54_02485 [Candidatus Woesearchaeota archaeon]|nr:hypothetical protein [Candidatus Woesearchaeota archaeon]
MKKHTHCHNCGRTLIGTGVDDDPADNELFCYFCEMPLVKFGKRKKSGKKQ